MSRDVRYVFDIPFDILYIEFPLNSLVAQSVCSNSLFPCFRLLLGAGYGARGLSLSVNPHNIETSRGQRFHLTALFTGVFQIPRDCLAHNRYLSNS